MSAFLERVFVLPWTEQFPLFGWVMLMGFLCGAACGVTGCFLLLRRLALLGDAVSHSVLPGLVVAFLLTGTLHPVAMSAGALCAGLLTAHAVQAMTRLTKLRQDAAVAVTFSALFAAGVTLISLYASDVHLDTDSVLYGEIGLVGLEPLRALAPGLAVPTPILHAAVVLAITVVFVVAGWRALLGASFDAGLARLQGLRPGLVHDALMAWLAVVVVTSFESVGAILVVAMLILPGATALLLARRLPVVLALAVVHAALAAVLGVHLAVALDAPPAPCMVLAGGGLLAAAWCVRQISRRVATA